MNGPVSVSPVSSTALVARTSSDAQLLALWLHGRSPHTQAAYEANVRRFLAFAGKPLAAVTLADLQGFADNLAEQQLAPTSQARILSAVKSLFTFAHQTGVLTLNVAAALRLPKARERLAERILSEAQVHQLLALEANPRNHALLRLLYAAGLRISEACVLHWRDLQPRGNAGQVTVYGKGGKTRAILLRAETWHELDDLRGSAADDDGDRPVFVSRNGKGNGNGGQPLTRRQATRIVVAAAKRAGITAAVSPHWLRHAHASHALDRGAPISLVQSTLGHASVQTTGRYLHARPDASSSQYLAI